MTILDVVRVTVEIELADGSRKLQKYFYRDEPFQIEMIVESGFPKDEYGNVHLTLPFHPAADWNYPLQGQ